MVSRQKQPYIKMPRKWVVCFMAILIMSVGAAVWVLGSENIITGPWSNVMSAAFTASGALLALLQWQFPFSSSTPILSLEKSHQEIAKVTSGSLLVRGKRQLCGTTIHLYHGFNSPSQQTDFAANMIEQRTEQGPEFIAEFHSLEPGNYTVYITNGPVANVTIPSNRTIEIDWRYLQIKKGVLKVSLRPSVP